MEVEVTNGKVGGEATTNGSRRGTNSSSGSRGQQQSPPLPPLQPRCPGSPHPLQQGLGLLRLLLKSLLCRRQLFLPQHGD